MLESEFRVSGFGFRFRVRVRVRVLRIPDASRTAAAPQFAINGHSVNKFCSLSENDFGGVGCEECGRTDLLVCAVPFGKNGALADSLYFCPSREKRLDCRPQAMIMTLTLGISRVAACGLVTQRLGVRIL